MDVMDALAQAWADTAPVVGAVRPQDLTTPTVCSGWNVRELLDHTLAESRMMSAVNDGAAATNDGAVLEDDDDPVTVWASIGRENVASWRRNGLDGTRSYFYGTFPAPVAAAVNLGEVIVHGWDVAQSLGRPFVIDADAANLVYEVYAAVPLDGLRNNGLLAAEVKVDPHAPVEQRLLALLGRTPR